MLGPALVAGAANRPERKNLALAALGEMIADKLPLVPSRDLLLPLLIRGLAGAWVARTIQQEEGGDTPPDPWIAPLGAAVAMGVAVVAPKARRTLTATTGVSDTVLGLVEDYLALRLGGDAVGLSMEEIGHIARSSLVDLKGHVEPVFEELGSAMHQSVGAGSM